MTSRLAHWPARRVSALWSAGLLLEAALLTLMFALLVRPDPPLVARLRGEDLRSAQTYTYIIDRSSGAPRPGAVVPLRPGPRAAPEDSFYTVVRWPPGRPLLAGGGHVVALPMRLRWVPALYVGAVPLLLVGVTGAWLWARRRADPERPGLAQSHPAA